MAKRKISDEELLSRREFFRKGAQTALPILVSITLPSIITSCTPDDDWGCSECSSICSYTCHESCSSSSTSSSCDSCSSSCVSSCSGTCSTTCEGSSQSSSCSGCSNSCSGYCAESCENSCSNNCSSTCENSSSSSGDTYNDISSASGTIDGYEYVDLGLSVKWARYNYGATSPSTGGTYMEFTEGVTGSKSDVVINSLLKSGYNKDNVSIAGSQFDSVSQNWGNKWRTPSKSEWEELINNSYIERYEYNGTIGLKFTSKKNGESIFLPGAGYYGDDNKYHYGYYWTSVLANIAPAYSSGYHIWWSFGKSGNYALHHDNTVNIRLYDSKMTIRPVTNGSNNPSTCNNSCTATCANNSTGSGCSSCGSNCSSSCGSNCSGACVNTCNTGCGKQCRYSCGGTCSQTCAGFCSGGCKGASKGSCSDCTGSCSYLCSKSCSQYCYSSCTNMGVKSL